jgi:MobA/MobL family
MAHLHVVPTCALCRGLKLRHSVAIYHLSASIVKRSAGRSVTAAAAYRAAVKIEDKATGLTHDYTRKQGVDYSEIIVPALADRTVDEWLMNREQLWNRVEQVEKRKDAQLAREITVAIPVELDRASQIELVREYVRSNYVDRGMIADINLHHLDGKNPHAHILLTMRNLQTSPEGEVEFGLKNTDWNNKDLLIGQRQNWEEIANRYLAASGSDARIDCRSLEEQGSPFIPQIHVGVHAMAMKHKGIATDRGEEFDRIEAENHDIRARLEEIYQGESAPESELKDENEDGRIGELLYQNIKSYQPINNQERQRKTISIGRYSISKNLANGINVQIDGGCKLLNFTLENEQWVKTIFYAGHYSHTKYERDEINKLAEDFDKVVENFSAEIKQIRDRGRNREQEDKLGESLDRLLKRWGQRIYYPEDIGLTFYRIRDDQISIYIDGDRPINTLIYSLKIVENQWTTIMQTKDEQYSLDRLIDMVDKQHYSFDTGKVKKLELTELEYRQVRGFEYWKGLELDDYRLAKIRWEGREIISTDLADDLVKWIDENIPATSESLTKDKIKEIVDNSQQPICIIKGDDDYSVYTNYLLVDKQENNTLEIRHNRGRLEMICGVVTPSISEQIKIIINELKNPKIIIDNMTLDIDRQIDTPIAAIKSESLASDIATTLSFTEKLIRQHEELKKKKAESQEPRQILKEIDRGGR